MILESIVTTVDGAGNVNIAPMGPIVDESMTRLLLRPFHTSTTYRNLKSSGRGVLHVTDDVLLLAQAALGRPDPPPAMQRAPAFDGWILSDACRWYTFEVDSIDDREPRTEITARVADRGRLRDFFGFNRAKHAVLEAAILATRLHILDRTEVENEIQRLKIPVEKTGGPRELAAWEIVWRHVEQAPRS